MVEEPLPELEVARELQILGEDPGRRDPRGGVAKMSTLLNAGTGKIQDPPGKFTPASNERRAKPSDELARHNVFSLIDDHRALCRQPVDLRKPSEDLAHQAERPRSMKRSPALSHAMTSLAVCSNPFWIAGVPSVVGLGHPPREPITVSFDDPEAAICRSSVDDDELHPGRSFRDDRTDRRVHIRRLVEARRDDANRWRWIQRLTARSSRRFIVAANSASWASRWAVDA